MIEFVSNDPKLTEMIKGRIDTSGLLVHRIVDFAYGATGENLEADTCYSVNRIVSDRDLYPDLLYDFLWKEAMSAEETVGEGAGTPVIVEPGIVQRFRSYASQYSYDRIHIFRHTSSERNDDVLRICESILSFFLKIPEPNPSPDALDAAWFKRLSDDMMLTVTLRNRLKQILLYAGLTQREEAERRIKELYHKGSLPCRNKIEGRRMLDAIEQELL